MDRQWLISSIKVISNLFYCLFHYSIIVWKPTPPPKDSCKRTELNWISFNRISVFLYEQENFLCEVIFLFIFLCLMYFASSKHSWEKVNKSHALSRTKMIKNSPFSIKWNTAWNIFYQRLIHGICAVEKVCLIFVKSILFSYSSARRNRCCLWLTFFGDEKTHRKQYRFHEVTQSQFNITDKR